MKKIHVLLICLTVAITSQSFTIAKKWDFLGERTVNKSLDKDEINVTAKEGVFKKIKLKVKKSKVEFKRVVVHYKNGDTQKIELRQEITAGGETRAIDLDGRNRVIVKVVFFYNTKRLLAKKAKVQLYGRN